jgi:hydroxylaminobenzene mutase
LTDIFESNCQGPRARAREIIGEFGAGSGWHDNSDLSRIAAPSEHSFQGFAVPYFTVPNLGRSVHTLSAFSGVLLLTLGLLWPRLDLGATSSRIAFWFLIYSVFATVATFLLAGVWGAGSSIMPLAADGARGSHFQEEVIRVVAYSAAPTVITSVGLILWGLRIKPAEP